MPVRVESSDPRRVPEFALVAGAVLGLAAAGFVLFAAGDPARAVVAGALLCYPFAGYAVRFDDDPTTVLVPRAVAVLGVALGAVALAVEAAATGTAVGAAVGLLFGLLVALPPLAYAAAHGTPPDWLPGRPVAAAAAVAGLALVGLAPVVGSTYPAVDGLLVGLAGTLYADSAGAGLRYRRRRGLAALGALAGAGATVAGATAGPLLPWVAAGVALAAGPAAYLALAVEFERR